MILAFCYNDGTIEFRKRSTMEPIMPDGNADTVSSLLQSGFVFPHVEPSLHVALSPNHCMMACMHQDGTIKLRSMEYQHGSLSVDDTDPRNSAAVAALILQTVSSTYQYFSGDDIFSVMGTLTDTRKTEFSNLLFEGLQLNTDCGVDDTNTNHLMLLGRSANFVKMLSAVHLLGLQGPINRSLQSKMAWTILNMKYVTQFLTQLARMHGSLEKTLLRAELVPLFIGVCRWIMHFMAYMLDELFTLGRALEDVPPATLTREFLEQAFTAHNIPIVLLLLSAFPRAMIKLWAQPLAWVKRSAENFTNPHAPTPAPEIRKLYAPLQAAFGEIPFDWRWVERLVSETQEHARAAFKKQNMDDAQRSLVERELLLGKLPDVFVPVARRLVTDQLWNDKIPGGCLADKVDSGRLMFFDTTWLGLQESKRAAAWHDTHVVDVCQKTIIRGIGAQTHPSASPLPGRGRSESIQSAGGDERKKKLLLQQQQQQQQQQLRRCVRCGAYMEDITQGMPGYTPYHASWLMSGAKHCVCGSSWTLATEKRAR
jgi:mediator of RNA polymerase II transcription subunit 16